MFWGDLFGLAVDLEEGSSEDAELLKRYVCELNATFGGEVFAKDGD